MGLKSKLNKMKSFLFDEEEEEVPVKKTTKKVSKKEEVKKEVDDEAFSKTQEIDNLYLEDISEPEPVKAPEIKSRVQKNEPEFKFPEFDDDDFMVSRNKPEPIIKPPKEEPKPLLYQGSKRKEEPKKFKPSPIISPIYGLLDNSGKKVKTEPSKVEVPKRSKDELTFDEIRKKAYGSLDDEIENTLKRLSNKTIEEAEKEMAKEDDVKELSRSREKALKHVREEKPVVVSSAQDDDDMILPSVNFKEIDVDKERSKMSEKRNVAADEDDDDDTKEQDLFNLIDTMYQEEEKED